MSDTKTSLGGALANMAIRQLLTTLNLSDDDAVAIIDAIKERRIIIGYYRSSSLAQDSSCTPPYDTHRNYTVLCLDPAQTLHTKGTLSLGCFVNATSYFTPEDP
jgi:hypothetical protein